MRYQVVYQVSSGSDFPVEVVFKSVNFSQEASCSDTGSFGKWLCSDVMLSLLKACFISIPQSIESECSLSLFYFLFSSSQGLAHMMAEQGTPSLLLLHKTFFVFDFGVELHVLVRWVLSMEVHASVRRDNKCRRWVSCRQIWDLSGRTWLYS